MKQYNVNTIQSNQTTIKDPAPKKKLRPSSAHPKLYESKTTHKTHQTTRKPPMMPLNTNVAKPSRRSINTSLTVKNSSAKFIRSSSANKDLRNSNITT